MNEAFNDELITTNPCRIVGAGKPRAKGAAEALSAHEVGPYLDAVEEYYRPALAVAVLGGRKCRRSIFYTVKRRVLTAGEPAAPHTEGMTASSQSRRKSALRAEQKRLRRVHGLAFSLLDDNKFVGN